MAVSITGTAGDDVFALTNSLVFIVDGLGGDDRFVFRSNFSAAFQLNGGSDADSLVLNGDYTGATAVAFGPGTLVGIERIQLHGGHDYDLASDDATVAAGESLAVNGSSLGAADQLIFDGSLETNGQFTLTGGAGDDALTGGAGDDFFNLKRGGNDTAHGGDGNDTFALGTALTAADSIDGGAGRDTVVLGGANYTSGNALVLGPQTLAGIEQLTLGPEVSYDITTDDATVAARDLLIVRANRLQSFVSVTFDGSAETDGRFRLLGGAGGDTLIGGAGNDSITGGDGGDLLTGNGGADAFVYTATSQSTGSAYDTINGFNASTDLFDFNFAVSSVMPTRNAFINAADLDSPSGGAGGDFVGAMVANVIGGDLAGRQLLLIDGDNNGFYQPNADYVIDITGFTGTITTSNFV